MSDPAAERSRPALILALYAAAVVVLAAAAAPWIFKAGHLGAEFIESRGLQDTPPFGYLRKVALESDFKRYFNRAVLVAALACLWPAARALRIRRSDFAAGANPRWISDLVLGFALGAGFLLAMGAALAAGDFYSWKEEIRWGRVLVRPLVTGFGVGIVEEFVFRGALFALLLRSLRPAPALIVLSVVFAALHFLKPPDALRVAAPDVDWTTGFDVAGAIFAHFGNPIFLLAEFATLFAVGLVLGDARLRTRSLALPIGLHAGWVFGIFAFRGLADASDSTGDGEHLPFIGENLKTGLAPVAVILLTWAIIAAARPRKTAVAGADDKIK